MTRFSDNSSSLKLHWRAATRVTLLSSLSVLLLNCGSRSDLNAFAGPAIGEGLFADGDSSADNSFLGAGGLGGTGGQRFPNPDSGGDLGLGGSPGLGGGPGIAGAAGRSRDGSSSSGGSDSTDGTAADDPQQDTTAKPPGFEPRISLGNPARCESSALSLDITLAGALQAVQIVQDPSRAPFLRYISVGHVLHEPCERSRSGGNRFGRLTGNRADLARFGVNALVNSLSQVSTLQLPTPLDAGMLLLEIDLRDYGWDRPTAIAGEQYANAWEAIAARAPQATQFTGPEADELKRITGTNFPLLLSSDLIFTATQSDLYYSILGLPDTFKGLKASLGVDPELPLRDEGWMLAGTTVSIVSQQNRRLARYLPASAAGLRFWQAFQYSPNSDYAGVFLDPLGPEFDGTVALFNLPNGRPAFYAADAEGNRATTADFLFDTRQPDFVTRPPISCMSCHTGDNVVFAIKDEVRELYEEGFSADPTEDAAVVRSYVEEDVFRDFARKDSNWFSESAADLGVPIEEDSIAREALYRDRDLAAVDAAGELFVDEQTLLDNATSLPIQLSILTTGGYTERGEFTSAYREALCRLNRNSSNRPQLCPNTQ